MLKKKYNLHLFLAIAILATWLKTYFAYQSAFSITLDNAMQEFILFLSPLSFLLIVYGAVLLFKKQKSRQIYLVTIATVSSIVLYANVAFYRFFTDFITLPVLFQTNNFGDLGSSAAASIYFSDIFYFSDVIIILLAIKFLSFKEVQMKAPAGRKSYFVLSAAVLFLNLGLAEAERPQLLTRSFDREMLVKNLGIYNYHLYDVYIQSKSQAQRAFADSSELIEVNSHVRTHQIKPSEEMKGIAEGKNLIVVTLESLQTFTINEQMNGETITPFMNSLTKDEDTIYFPNFYHQTGLGKTADAEFLLENSLYPLGGSAAFFTHAGNTYNSMAEKLGNQGYATNVQHANNKSFWNRDMMFESMGIDEFLDIQSYEIGDGQAVNWGMKDIPFFEQSVQHMTEMPQPFYSRLITLTNHHPFTLDPQDKLIEEFDSNSGTLNRYFQTTRYLDEALKELFQELKDNGLYEDSIIVLYGDHYGISENHNAAMSQYLEREVTPYESAKLQRVPLFFHIPGYGAGYTHEELGAQIDLRPTILNMLGVESKTDVQFGNDLFAEDHEEFVIFRDGRLVTEDFVYAGNTCYENGTGDVIDQSFCEPYIEEAFEEISYSDALINGDLLRFYNEENGRLLENP